MHVEDEGRLLLVLPPPNAAVLAMLLELLSMYLSTRLVTTPHYRQQFHLESRRRPAVPVHLCDRTRSHHWAIPRSRIRLITRGPEE